MDVERITTELSVNQAVFRELFSKVPEEEIGWKPAPDKWCLLEVVCHLYDEEREDFRARIRSTLEDPGKKHPPINPTGWVAERKYMEQNFDQTVEKFLMEREWSMEWLRTLENPSWDNAYIHPVFGKMTAKMFLYNWLAHDYLHIRQILGLKFKYHEYKIGESLNYAGEW